MDGEMMTAYNTWVGQWRDGSPTVQVHTSGSTGTPKVIEVEKRRMLASAAMTCDFLGLRRGDKALLCLPLEYIAGKMMVVRTEYAGLQLDIVQPSGHPLSTVSERTYDFVAMVPMQVYNTMREPVERDCLSRIRHLIIGGGAVDDALAAELRQMPNAVWSTYGMTETLSHVAMRRLSGDDADMYYTPLPGVRVTIDDDSRIVVDAPHVCAERLVTNDIGELDEATGRFRVLGRIDNVICTGGIKVMAEEIERLLREHIDVPLMVTSRPDPRFGEAVVLLHGSEDVEGIAGACSCLPSYMRPKDMLRVAALPMTPNGKPARAEARAMAAKMLDDRLQNSR